MNTHAFNHEEMIYCFGYHVVGNHDNLSCNSTLEALWISFNMTLARLKSILISDNNFVQHG